MFYFPEAPKMAQIDENLPKVAQSTKLLPKKQTHFNVGFREQADLAAGVLSFPPAFADVGPGQGEDLPGRDAQLASVRLGVEIVQSVDLKKKHVNFLS